MAADSGAAALGGGIGGVFGLVNGHEAEVGYIDLNELANARGRMGIGIEIDMHFKPQTLAACREAIHA